MLMEAILKREKKFKYCRTFQMHFLDMAIPANQLTDERIVFILHKRVEIETNQSDLRQSDDG